MQCVNNCGESIRYDRLDTTQRECIEAQHTENGYTPSIRARKLDKFIANITSQNEAERAIRQCSKLSIRTGYGLRVSKVRGKKQVTQSRSALEASCTSISIVHYSNVMMESFFACTVTADIVRAMKSARFSFGSAAT